MVGIFFPEEISLFIESMISVLLSTMGFVSSKREYSIILFSKLRTSERILSSSPFMVPFPTDVLTEKLEEKLLLASKKK